MAASSSDDGVISSINVTPLVDVVLVLLIILMVTATSLAAQTIPLELPQAATGEESESVLLAVSVDAHGQIYVDETPVSSAELRAKIQELRDEGSEVNAVVGADATTDHSHVVGIIDVLRGEGVFKFAIQVKEMESPR
ncbi:MAG: biopolymer transporter ExbD [Myxococcota bacterium]